MPHCGWLGQCPRVLVIYTVRWLARSGRYERNWGCHQSIDCLILNPKYPRLPVSDQRELRWAIKDSAKQHNSRWSIRDSAEQRGG